MCENLDVELEAIACVHSLQYSTVQLIDFCYPSLPSWIVKVNRTYHAHRFICSFSFTFSVWFNV